MTLNSLITLLNSSGINSKGKVKKALETENIEELEELRWSITERINLLKIKGMASNGKECE